jgi:aldehyde dehydrogenase (NAD+)/betaine-aldehyde dehydrogenase
MSQTLSTPTLVADTVGGEVVLVGDRWERGAAANRILKRDPTSEEVVLDVPGASVAQADAAVSAARAAFDSGEWDRLGPSGRSERMHRLVDQLEQQHELLAQLVVTEVGSPIELARSMQVGAALDSLRWYADLAERGPDGSWERHLPDSASPPSSSTLVWRPAGVVAAITAYNFPLILAAWKIGAALAAGCTVVLSPSPRAFATNVLLARAALDAGIPPGVLNLVVGDAEIGQTLTSHPAVDMVSFTGSLEVGKEVQRRAADTIKKVVLELGGKSPTVLLPNADLDEALTPAVLRFTRNAGQGCGCTTRILVPADRYDEVSTALAEVVDALVVGDPREPGTDVGPLISEEHRDRVQGYIDRAVDAGATIVAGGVRAAPAEGYFLSPMILGGLTPDAEICRDELFAPVAVLLPYDDLDDAAAIAADTVFGLNAAVYGPTADALKFARRLRTGAVGINGGGPSRPDGPWGGFGQSGVGREGGEDGLREFLEVQHVQVALTDGTTNG